MVSPTSLDGGGQGWRSSIVVAAPLQLLGQAETGDGGSDERRHLSGPYVSVSPPGASLDLHAQANSLQ
jgi:hypothetical protein